MFAPDLDWTTLGEIELSTAAHAVDAFADALAGDGEPAPSVVPATFAAVVLARPEIMGALQGLAEENSAVLVHQAQQFRFLRPLEIDATYRVRLDWHREPQRPDRLIVRARVRDGADTLCQEFRTDIVLFARPPARTENGS
ncbi:hypothetical protein [Stappia sp. ICDLI1TA098]